MNDVLDHQTIKAVSEAFDADAKICTNVSIDAVLDELTHDRATELMRANFDRLDTAEEWDGLS